jgi:hypothetical protein
MFPSGIQPRTPFVRNRVIEYDAIGGVIQDQGFSSPAVPEISMTDGSPADQSFERSTS